MAAEVTVARGDWVRALTALPAEQVTAVAGEVAKDMRIQHRQIPRTGLGLLTLEESTKGERFFLGEFPLAIAEVEIETSDGRRASGGAQVMADWAEWATALAVCDAVLANTLPGAERVAELVKEGMAVREREKRVRKSILARTHVDFSLLSTVEQPNEESGDDRIG